MRTLIAIALATAIVFQAEAKDPVNPLGDYQLLSQPGDPQPQYVVYVAAGIVVITIYVGWVAVRAVVHLMDSVNSNQIYWSNYSMTMPVIDVPTTAGGMLSFTNKPLVIQQRTGMTTNCPWENVAEVYFAAYYESCCGYFCFGVANYPGGGRSSMTVPLGGGGSAELDFKERYIPKAEQTTKMQFFRAYQ